MWQIADYKFRQISFIFFVMEMVLDIRSDAIFPSSWQVLLRNHIFLVLLMWCDVVTTNDSIVAIHL